MASTQERDLAILTDYRNLSDSDSVSGLFFSPKAQISETKSSVLELFLG